MHLALEAPNLNNNDKFTENQINNKNNNESENNTQNKNDNNLEDKEEYNQQQKDENSILHKTTTKTGKVEQNLSLLFNCSIFSV